MAGPRVGLDRDLEGLQGDRRLHEGGLVVGHVIVLLGQMDPVRRIGPGEVDLLAPVERDGGAHSVRQPYRGPEGE